MLFVGTAATDVSTAQIGGGVRGVYETDQILKLHARVVVKPNNPYHWLANPMVWASDYYPKALLKPIPSWFKELTHEPAA